MKHEFENYLKANCRYSSDEQLSRRKKIKTKIDEILPVKA